MANFTRERIEDLVEATVRQQWRDGRTAGEIQRDIVVATIDVWPVCAGTEDYVEEPEDQQIARETAAEVIATLIAEQNDSEGRR